MLRGSPAIVLLSARPEAHAILVDSLCERGVTVRVARPPVRALSWLRAEPELVLIDLVHGAGLSPQLVTALNSRRGRTRVLALHCGGFGNDSSMAGLTVDGFCRADATDFIAGALSTCRRVPATTH
ncbi:MAG TPA: hypothetical protein VEY91_02110 [Candidatus Limnocylindria bacterium]|nr:hypothetical protein [Candidatus Limnocylindria bacterium]